MIARSQDGVSLMTVAELDESHFGAIDRAARARRTGDGAGGLRLPGHAGEQALWIGVLEADDLKGLAGADVRTAFPGDEEMVSRTR